MKVSSLAEEVTVKGESPVVDSKSANVNVNLDKLLLENTPGGKDIWNILPCQVPGLIFDVPDVAATRRDCSVRSRRVERQTVRTPNSSTESTLEIQRPSGSR